MNVPPTTHAPPPIVFLHGSGLAASFWQPCMDAMGSPNRRLAIDLPGHGSLAAQTFTLRAAVDHVRATIRDQLDDAPCIVVGLSLGGYVALAFVAAYPEFVPGLVLAGCSSEPRSVLPAFAATELMLRVLPAPVLRGVSLVALRILYARPIGDSVASGGLSFRGAADGLRALRARRFLPLLAAYPGTMLILNGSRDVLFRLDESRFLEAAQDGWLYVVRRAGHLSPLDRPQEVARTLDRFARLVALKGSSVTENTAE